MPAHLAHQVAAGSAWRVLQGEVGHPNWVMVASSPCPPNPPPAPPACSLLSQLGFPAAHPTACAPCALAAALAASPHSPGTGRALRGQGHPSAPTVPTGMGTTRPQLLPGDIGDMRLSPDCRRPWRGSATASPRGWQDQLFFRRSGLQRGRCGGSAGTGGDAGGRGRDRQGRGGEPQGAGGTHRTSPSPGWLL